MKELLVVASLSIAASLLSSAMYVGMDKIRECEYLNYLERVEKGQGYNGW